MAPFQQQQQQVTFEPGSGTSHPFFPGDGGGRRCDLFQCQVSPWMKILFQRRAGLLSPGVRLINGQPSFLSHLVCISVSLAKQPSLLDVQRRRRN